MMSDSVSQRRHISLIKIHKILRFTLRFGAALFFFILNVKVKLKKHFPCLNPVCDKNYALNNKACLAVIRQATQMHKLFIVFS